MTIDSEKIKERLLILKAKYSLHEFLKQGWSIIEGHTPFTDGWHISAIAEHLEAVSLRQIKNLLINIPPRTSKTSLISVAFPAWVWLHNPEEKFMYASYATSLANEHSLKCRRLIESEWYAILSGRAFELSKDQKAKSFFENNKTGYRISTSVGASTTGKGASILIADDPNNAKEGESVIKRDGTNNWWDQVWSTRLNNPKNDCRIIVQQRIHQKDISGHILEADSTQEWVKLILPMEFEQNRCAKTISLPKSKSNQIWCDPRTTEGELLCPDRFSKTQIERYKRELGMYGYAGQYQQRPSPITGGIIKKTWFKWWKNPMQPDIEFVIQSWDTAITGKDTSAYSACTTWGIFRDHNNICNIILLSLWRNKVEYPVLRERAKRLYFDYRDTEAIRDQSFKGKEIDICIIEAKATGDPLIQDLQQAGIRAIPFNPVIYKNRFHDNPKVNRTHLITPLIESGIVWLPTMKPTYDRLLPFADLFLECAAAFPSDESNDVIDTMTQALLKLKENGYLTIPKDYDSRIQNNNGTIRVGLAH